MRSTFRSLAEDAGAEPLYPPDEIVRELRLLGWAIYEAALLAIHIVQPAFLVLLNNSRQESIDAYNQIRELSQLGQTLPWPEFSLRALGAVRSQALAHSLKDSEAGYQAARTVHKSLEDLLQRRTDEITSGIYSDTIHYLDLKRDVDELAEQSFLARTGTACREPEHSLCRWSEAVAAGRKDDSAQKDELIHLAHGLRIGIISGERAMNRAEHILGNYDVIAEKDATHLLGPTMMQNPAIMTARAHLLVLPMCPRLESYGMPVPGREGSWSAYIENLVDGFTAAYARIESSAEMNAANNVQLIYEHFKALVQLRLAFFLLFPERALPTRLESLGLDQGCDLNDLDSISKWLVAHKDADVNVISSATMPEYLRGIEQLRSVPGYREWRENWLNMDRFSSEEGRRDRVLAALQILSK
ncbi:hypothetical protein [Gordonia alkaliphila]|uniref:hypothetical protein n=1 Tax=Gordonia alkaliphila TaxID=1053547 RepID=UPI0031ECD96E